MSGCRNWQTQMNEDFCVFILSHGRASNVRTANSLKEHGYTGEVILVIDDEDEQAADYGKNFKRVEMFSKKNVAGQFDIADNFESTRGVVYARNACFQIAKKLGYAYFMQLDDDYTRFEYRVYSEKNQKPKKISNLDKVIDGLLQFYKSTNVATVAMAQGGDFIGGKNNKFAKNPTLTRKCMNSFICSTDRVFQFNGRINEDVNMYTDEGSRGLLACTIPFCSLVQVGTQKNSEGMTTLYLEHGTYVKSFYSVMFQPSSVKVALMGDTHKRVHHVVSWDNTVPKIVSETVKKTA